MIGHGELVADLTARAADAVPTVLTAPPGRGKSALLDAVAEPWIAREDHVVWLTAAPTDRDVPFAALADLLTEAPDLPEPWLAALKQALRRIPGTPDRVAIRLAAAHAWTRQYRPTKASCSWPTTSNGGTRTASTSWPTSPATASRSSRQPAPAARWTYWAARPEKSQSPH